MGKSPLMLKKIKIGIFICPKDDEINRKKAEEDKKREEERKKDLNNDPFAAHNFDIKIDLDVAPPGNYCNPF